MTGNRREFLKNMAAAWTAAAFGGLAGCGGAGEGPFCDVSGSTPVCVDCVVAGYAEHKKRAPGQVHVERYW